MDGFRQATCSLMDEYVKLWPKLAECVNLRVFFLLSVTYSQYFQSLIEISLFPSGSADWRTVNLGSLQVGEQSLTRTSSHYNISLTVRSGK